MKCTWLAGLLSVTLSSVLVAACSSTPDPPPAEGGNGVLPASPQTPSPCTAGETRACNVVVSKRPGWVNCYSGTETCTGGGTWGGCGDGTVVTRAFRPDLAASSAGDAFASKTLAVGTAPTNSGPPCSDDACNPFCWGFNEVPVAPLAVGSVVPGLSVKTGGVSSCAGAPDFTTGACLADPYRACQQDFHCDAATDACVWNVPGPMATPYTDAACPGVDLTVGAPCYDSMTDTSHYPVCNRGMTGLTTGIVTLHEIAGNAWDCVADPIIPGMPAATWDAGLAPIAAGACVDVTATGLVTGNRHVVVNGGKTIAECGIGFASPGGGGCLNNNAPARQNTAGPTDVCAACGAAPATSTGFTAPVYHATCPPGARPVWDLFMWAIQPPESGTWSVAFSARTAPDASGAPGAFTAPIPLASPPAASEPAVRTLANALDLFAKLGGEPAATNEWLELRIDASSELTGLRVDSWQLTYSCRPTE